MNRRSPEAVTNTARNNARQRRPVRSAIAVISIAMCVRCGGLGGHPLDGPEGGVLSGNDGSHDLGNDAGDQPAADAAGGGPVGDDAGASHDAQSLDGGPDSGGGAAPMEGGAGGYEPCPTDGGTCKVLPLGDSITYGIQYPGAYRVELFHDALSDHRNITFVGDHSLADGPTTVDGVAFPQDNDGHSGWTIDQIAGLVPSPALQTNPDIVLLMIGTNDMYSQTQPVAQAPARLAALVDAIVAADAHALLVVAEITPLQNSAWETQVVTYNAAIPAVVQARAAMGKHVALVDLHTSFVTATMLSSDGVHPNKAGYDHMGDLWYAAVKDVLR